MYIDIFLGIIEAGRQLNPAAFPVLTGAARMPSCDSIPQNRRGDATSVGSEIT
jgi:hypothetical protein